MNYNTVRMNEYQRVCEENEKLKALNAELAQALEWMDVQAIYEKGWVKIPQVEFEQTILPILKKLGEK